MRHQALLTEKQMKRWCLFLVPSARLASGDELSQGKIMHNTIFGECTVAGIAFHPMASPLTPPPPDHFPPCGP